MTSNRNTPWIHFRESGELVCTRCDKRYVPTGASFEEIKIEGERFALAHKKCKPKVGTATVKR